jgi:hypothetical protein
MSVGFQLFHPIPVVMKARSHVRGRVTHAKITQDGIEDPDSDVFVIVFEGREWRLCNDDVKYRFIGKPDFSHWWLDNGGFMTQLELIDE